MNTCEEEKFYMEWPASRPPFRNGIRLGQRTKDELMYLLAHEACNLSAALLALNRLAPNSMLERIQEAKRALL